jgi:hypothetical protein
VYVSLPHTSLSTPEVYLPTPRPLLTHSSPTPQGLLPFPYILLRSPHPLLTYSSLTPHSLPTYSSLPPYLLLILVCSGTVGEGSGLAMHGVWGRWGSPGPLGDAHVAVGVCGVSGGCRFRLGIVRCLVARWGWFTSVDLEGPVGRLARSRGA